jgi:hypothetical protein
VGAEFGHVAEHGDAPAFARQVLKRLQRRNGRVGIGVVSVVEDADAVEFPELEAHFRRAAFGQAALDVEAAQSEFPTQSNGKKRVVDLVPAEQVDPVIAGIFLGRRFDAERGAVFVEADIESAPVVGLPVPNSN